MRPRVVVSLTSIPPRIDSITPTIESLLTQTLAPDQIYLWYPETFLRDFGPKVPLPTFLKKEPRLTIGSCEDRLALNKLLPVLRCEKDPETCILTVDDDTIYPKTLIANYLEWEKRYPHAALGLKGKVILDRNKKNYWNVFGAKGKGRKPQNVDTLIGGMSIFFKRKFLHNAVFHPPFNPCSHDIWFAGMLAKSFIPRFVVPFDKYEEIYSYQNNTFPLKEYFSAEWNNTLATVREYFIRDKKA